MHELAIAAEILEKIRCVVSHPAVVRQVTLALGPLSGVHADALTFAFNALAERYGCKGAVLTIRSTRVSATCTVCNSQYECVDFEAGCPVCGSLERNLTGGTDCRVESVDVEDDHV